MVLLGSLAMILNMLLQAAPTPAAGDFLNATERAQLEKATSIERRIKIYLAVSKRIQRALRDAIGKDTFEPVPDMLKQWTELLAKSCDDIQANLKTKRKSRELIKYEIEVRKAIEDMQGFKIRAPVDQQDAFDSCLTQAEAIRKKFVDILFRS